MSYTENLKAIKTAKDIKLVGVHIALTKKDGSWSQLRIDDGEGNSVIIDASYGMNISIPVPAPMKKAFHLHGTLAEMKYSRVFAEKYEAEVRKREWENKLDDDAKLEISEIEVPEDQEFGTDETLSPPLPF